jgi:hypothetical protein
MKVRYLWLVLLSGFFTWSNLANADIVVRNSGGTVQYENFVSTTDTTANHYGFDFPADTLKSDFWLIQVEVNVESEPPTVNQLIHLNSMSPVSNTDSSIAWNFTFEGHQFDIGIDYSFDDINNFVVSTVNIDHDYLGFSADGSITQARIKLYNFFDYDAVLGDDQLSVVGSNRFEFTDSALSTYLAFREALTGVSELRSNVDFGSFSGGDLGDADTLPGADLSAAFQWDATLLDNDSFSVTTQSFVAVPEPGSLSILAAIAGITALGIRRRPE